MKYSINGIDFDVIIEYKNNKNTYMRVKENNIIHVTTHYLVSKKRIIEMIENNKKFILNNYSKLENKKEKEENFYLLGKKYNVIIMKNSDIEIIGDNIYTPDLKKLDKWLKKEILDLYKKRLEIIYNRFEEAIPYPSLRIRTMKTRWGVCNRRLVVVTLNSELIKYDISALDYVIVHELSHFIHSNHSSSFWSLVSKYCPDYKKIRKDLKE